MYHVPSSVQFVFVVIGFHVVLSDTPETFKRPTVLEECSVGTEGTPGPRGPPGESGPQGIPVPVSKNWRQCSWYEQTDGGDNNEVYSCEFTKEYEDTSIYVSMSTNMRVAYTDGACCRWFFKFNGAECSDPGRIEALTFAGGYSSYNLHRPRVLNGLCDGLSAGSVTVTFWVGNCAGYGYFDCYTGWKSASHLMIEEYTPSPY